MSLEFEIPLVSLIFITILNVVYFTKKNINLIENKFFEKILISSLITTFLNTVIHLIFSIYDFNYVISNYDSTMTFLNKIAFTLVIFISLALFSYLLIISFEKVKKNSKYLNLGIYLISIFVFIIMLFSEFEFVDMSLVTGAKGPAVDITYILIFINMIASFILSLIFIKRRDKRYYSVFYIVLFSAFFIAITIVFPQFNIYDLIIAIVCYMMFFTIENPDLKTIRELNLASIEADTANNAKTDFLASMSHEIRTPLNAIVGFSQAILDIDTGNPQVDEYANDVVSSSNTLLEIIGGILDISKIESNKLKIIETPYITRDEINNTINLVKAKVGEKNLKFTVDIAQDIPYELIGDKTNIKKIVTNLLTNAVKYTNEGEITLTIKCINKDNISYIMISVQDTGTGIKEEQIAKLFTRFERLDVEKNTTTEGTGLGLAITKRLVELMGGNINVKSQYGIGSIFVVHLPQKISKMTRDLTDTMLLDTVQLEQKRALQRLKNSQRKILVVDDNKLNIKVAKIALAPLGFEVDEVLSGKEAIDRIKKNSYDLILMDIMMPEMSGEECFKILKSDPNFNIPVVALTADAVAGSKEKYLEIGFTDYIAKPFSKDEIKIVLEKIFNE